MPTVGVLSLQGGVAEHVGRLRELGAQVRRVRLPADLQGLGGLVIPGGESSVMDRLARRFGLDGPLRSAIRSGLPVLGTCAGLIYLSKRVEGLAPGQRTLGALDVTTVRNAFGNQQDSFETTLRLSGPTFGDLPGVAAVFIRAPLVVEVSSSVEVLATIPAAPVATHNSGLFPTENSVDPSPQQRIVAVKQGNILALSFHPESTADPRLHAHWLATL